VALAVMLEGGDFSRPSRLLGVVCVVLGRLCERRVTDVGREHLGANWAEAVL